MQPMNAVASKRSSEVRACLTVVLALVVWGCASMNSSKEKETPKQLRDAVRAEHDEILLMVYEKHPELKEKVAGAAGYATFSTVNVNLLLLATARGDGIVYEKETGKETFMRVASIGGGLGAGIKDLRALFIFNELGALREFIDSGWQFGAQADASLKSGDTGGELGESVAVAASEDGGVDTGATGGVAEVSGSETAIEIYTITEAGISLQATVAGTKYWKDDELN